MQPTPLINTLLQSPLQTLEKQFLLNQAKIEAWFRQQWQLTPAPLMGSVDLRNAGFKLSPVDTNLFPAGFNNLNREYLSLAIQAAQSSISQAHPNCKSILLISESRTRNPFYYDSLATLQEILKKSGFNVRVGSLLEDLKDIKYLELTSGKQLQLEPVIREENKIKLKDFTPCLVLLNNDFAEGVPDILKGLEQTIRPGLQLSWATRLKSTHFSHYLEITKEFSELLDIDDWLITPLFRNCGNVDFVEREGEECMVKNVDALMSDIKKKYAEYNIEHPPFAVVKADAGTYGMGVMMVKDAQELRNLNRKQRSKMATTKGMQKITKVIIQEGVYTFETWGQDNAVAEPVVYMIGQHVVGGFYRIHEGRGKDENLNAPGMQFEPLAFTETCINPDPDMPAQQTNNLFYTYGVIARLALLAAARELKKVEKSA